MSFTRVAVQPMLIPIKKNQTIMYDKYYNDFHPTITTILNDLKKQSKFTWHTYSAEKRV